VATVAVDKTGTLTDNRLAVIGVATGVGVARERVLGVAAAWRSVVGIRWPVPASRGCVGVAALRGSGCRVVMVTGHRRAAAVVAEQAGVEGSVVEVRQL